VRTNSVSEGREGPQVLLVREVASSNAFEKATAPGPDKFNRYLVAIVQLQYGAAQYHRPYAARQLAALIDHNEGDLCVPCDAHHRARFFAVHEIPGPTWDPSACSATTSWRASSSSRSAALRWLRAAVPSRRAQFVRAVRRSPRAVRNSFCSVQRSPRAVENSLASCSGPLAPCEIRSRRATILSRCATVLSFEDTIHS
jgi:hypothetical protein